MYKDQAPAQIRKKLTSKYPFLLRSNSHSALDPAYLGQKSHPHLCLNLQRSRESIIVFLNMPCLLCCNSHSCFQTFMDYLKVYQLSPLVKFIIPTMFLSFSADRLAILVQSLLEEVVLHIQLLLSCYIHSINAQIWNTLRIHDRKQRDLASGGIMHTVTTFHTHDICPCI